MDRTGRKPPLDIYTELPPINTQRIKLNSTTPFTPTYVKNNVTQSADPAALYASRVKGRQILLDNPARGGKAKLEREAKKSKRIANKARSDADLIGRNQVRGKGLWKLARSETSYNAFLAIHQLWLDYMTELMALSMPSTSRQPADAHPIPNASALHAKLIKADFHGAIITGTSSDALRDV
ncbi:hypothetical protein EIP86_004114 [Pleurotus ostreatoroseus]|nr:hypothetical protein EIP86_004114 [Pleurotus ostreatoroseus]